MQHSPKRISLRIFCLPFEFAMIFQQGIFPFPFPYPYLWLPGSDSRFRTRVLCCNVHIKYLCVSNDIFEAASNVICHNLRLEWKQKGNKVKSSKLICHAKKILQTLLQASLSGSLSHTLSISLCRYLGLSLVICGELQNKYCRKKKFRK